MTVSPHRWGTISTAQQTPGRRTLRLVAQAAGAVPSRVTSRGMECLVKATSAGRQGLQMGEGWLATCVRV